MLVHTARCEKATSRNVKEVYEGRHFRTGENTSFEAKGSELKFTTPTISQFIQIHLKSKKSVFLLEIY